MSGAFRARIFRLQGRNSWQSTDARPWLPPKRGITGQYAVLQNSFFKVNFFQLTKLRSESMVKSSRSLKELLFYRELFLGSCTFFSRFILLRISHTNVYRLKSIFGTLWPHDGVQKYWTGDQSCALIVFLQVQDLFSSRLTDRFMSAKPKKRLRRLCTAVCTLAVHTALHLFAV